MTDQPNRISLIEFAAFLDKKLGMAGVEDTLERLEKLIKEDEIDFQLDDDDNIVSFDFASKDKQ